MKGDDNGDNGMGMNRSRIGHQKFWNVGRQRKIVKSYHLGAQNTRQEQSGARYRVCTLWEHKWQGYLNSLFVGKGCLPIPRVERNKGKECESRTHSQSSRVILGIWGSSYWRIRGERLLRSPLSRTNGWSLGKKKSRVLRVQPVMAIEDMGRPFPTSVTSWSCQKQLVSYLQSQGIEIFGDQMILCLGFSPNNPGSVLRRLRCKWNKIGVKQD